MGGSSKALVNSLVDPIGSVASAVTGDDIKLSPFTVGKEELYDKPKQLQKDIQDEIARGEEEARRAEDAFKKDQSEEKKKQRDLALQNLQRSQARLRSLQSQKTGGYSGTILTSPLGVSSDPNAAGTQKTLLGY